MMSILAHCRLREKVEDAPLDNGLRQKILNQYYEDMRPTRFSIPEDFMSYEHFRRVVGKLDWTSSPGYPYIAQGYTSNGRLFGTVDGVPDELKVQLFWNLLQQRLKDRDADPVRFFIKGEPHSFRKLAQHRNRLISSVSVLDQLIDLMIFGAENDAIVENWLRVPPKIGWTPLKGGWKIVPQSPPEAADKTAWDWTLQAWLVGLLEETTVGSCLNPTTYWRELVSWRYRMLYHDTEFIVGSGLSFKQKFIGMMKSGCVQTIVSNSKCQMFINYRACLEAAVSFPRYFWCMGDDTLQERMPSRYWEFLSKYCILKQVHRKTEFAGMRFKGSSVTPLYLPKHAYNLLHHNDRYRSELGLSYNLLYHRSENRDLISPCIRALAIPPAGDWLDNIYDG